MFCHSILYNPLYTIQCELWIFARACFQCVRFYASFSIVLNLNLLLLLVLFYSVQIGIHKIRMNLTVITPSLIAFLFRITIPIGFRMNFFGMAVEQSQIRIPKLSQQSVVTIRMGNYVCVVYTLFMWFCI